MPFTSGLFVLFIGAFLPVYMLCERVVSPRAAHSFTAVASAAFVAVYYPPLVILPLLQAGICTWFVRQPRTRSGLTLALVLTLAPLVYFKYFSFLLSCFDVVIDPVPLPLGISFYSFTAIGLLVDHIRKPAATEGTRFLDALNFLTFWPHLASGPILRTKSFLLPALTPYGDRNVRLAMILLVYGLAKKVFLADGVGGYVDQNLSFGIDGMGPLDAACTLLGMALRIYGDFSGYSDMAIGFALLIGVRLPANFNYPYVATSLTDFWRRWHISLSTWFRDYVYIPLGGSRHGLFRALGAVFVTFLLSGIWHGAAWNFVIWGALHGLGLVVERLVRGKLPIPALLSFALTFCFVTLSWSVFFLPADEAWRLVAGLWAPAAEQEVYNTGVIVAYGLFVVIDGWLKPYRVDGGGYPIARTRALLLIPWVLVLTLLFAGRPLPFIYFEF